MNIKYKFFFLLIIWFLFVYEKIIYYFRVVFAGDDKQYFVERITYSSRLVNNTKIASMHKRHLKVYARPVFDMFCNIVFKIYDVKKKLWCQNVYFRLKFLPALKTGPVFLIPLNRNLFLQIPYKTMEKKVSLKVNADYEYRLWACCSLTVNHPWVINHPSVTPQYKGAGLGEGNDAIS